MRYVIATSRAWNEVLVKYLEGKTARNFHLITQKEDLTLDVLKKINPRYIFFPHWSHIIPKEIYEALDCVIFHMTDLPYGRGGSPLQNLIQRGHNETKISALLCGSELDALEAYAEEMRVSPHSRSMAHVEVLAHHRGYSIGVDAAEAFEVYRIIR